MSAIFCNCNRAVWKYKRHLDSCDISDNSDSSNSSDSSDIRQEQTSLHVLTTVYISNLADPVWPVLFYKQPCH